MPPVVKKFSPGLNDRFLAALYEHSLLDTSLDMNAPSNSSHPETCGGGSNSSISKPSTCCPARRCREFPVIRHRSHPGLPPKLSVRCRPLNSYSVPSDA